MLNKHIIEAIQRTVDDDLGNVVIVHNQPQQIIKQLANVLAWITRTYLAKGQERLEIDNGNWISIIRMSGHGRRLTANLLILPIGLSMDDRETLMPIIAATQGDILGYL